MRVTISCHGTFHAFQLARQLARRGALERLLTSDPRVLRDRGIPLGRAWTMPISELVGRVPAFMPALRGVLPWEQAKLRIHDRWAAAAMGHPDLVVAWSGAARRVLARAHERGIVSVLERGSTHILHQDRVLREESARFQQQGGLDPENIRAELEEYALADRIMVPSKFARRTFIAQGVAPEKVLQVPYSADIALFSPGVKRDDVFRILFTGGVTLRKGVTYLLEAFRRLRLPNSELVLMGPIAPEMFPILRSYEGLYRCTGALDRSQVSEQMRQGSVFVHPSLEEGLSLAMREALATGLPVIATPETGAEDALVDGREGFLVPSRDVDALAARLEQLYRDPALRNEMGRQALANARGWTWGDYGDAVLTAYEGALSDVRHRSP